MVGLPYSAGNPERGRCEKTPREGGWGVRKHEDKNKPYTFPLFSPFETRNELCCFLCFCCIRDSLHPIQVKEERKKKLKLNKVDMKGGNKRWRKRRATARGIYSSNITPLMFPDMEWEHRTGQQLQIIKRTTAATYWSRAGRIKTHIYAPLFCLSLILITFVGLPNMQNQDMSLVLSTDAKPRLKWTPELHHRFVEAVAHLGGPDSEYISPYYPTPFCTSSYKIKSFDNYIELLMFFYISILAEATPKTLMRVMGVPGLTLYHLKSHLQAFSVYSLCSLY